MAMTATAPTIDRAIWVSIRTAAQKTGIPARTIRWWADDERIRVLQAGGPGAWRLVHLADLIALASGKGTRE